METEHSENLGRRGGWTFLARGVTWVCRLILLPAAWWAVIGFGGVTGTQQIKGQLGSGTVGAAALVALALTVISLAAFWPSPPLPAGSLRRGAKEGGGRHAARPVT